MQDDKETKKIEDNTMTKERENENSQHEIISFHFGERWVQVLKKLE